MKLKSKLFNITTIITVIGFIILLMTGCETIVDNDRGSYTPRATDFIIGNLSQTVNNITAVTIMPNLGKSNGAITIYYNGSSKLPTAVVGSYTVTFDVAATDGWKSAKGLSAGTLKIYTANYHIINSIADLANFFSRQNNNTVDNPYYIALNVNDLGGNAGTYGSIGYLLGDNNTKYVYLDLSNSTITTIPLRAFYNGNYHDYNENGLVGITIPNSVTYIGANAFRYCDNLTEINVDSDNTNYSSTDGVLYNKDKTILITYPEGKTGDFTIPNGVTTIGSDAFYGCDNLTGVIIPNGVIRIGSYAFYDCWNLTSVTIPNSVTSIGDRAFSWCDKLTEITIPDSVTKIGDRAFYNCDSLTSVTFAGTINLTNFSNYAFDGDLRNKYLAGGKGTYTRDFDNDYWYDYDWTWTKQP